MLIQDFSDPVGAIAGAVFGAVVVAVIENDNGKGASAWRNLQDAGYRQAVAVVGNWIAGKRVSNQKPRAYPDFPGWIVTFTQSGDGIGEDAVTQGCWAGETRG